MLERIQDALRRDAVDEALALAQDWAASAPDDAVAQRTLALALARAGDPAAALFALDQAILLAPEDAGLHFERASLLLRSGGVDEAGAALAQGLELDPNHLPSYLAKAHVALARGDLDEAERLSRTAARIAAEDDPRLLGLDALLALRRGNPDRALALASSAPPRELAGDAVAALEAHDWPGNVRELHNVLERVVAMTDDPVLTARHIRAALPPAPAAPERAAGAGARPLGDLLRDTERTAIVGALSRTGGVKAQAAKLLGISRASLYERMQTLGIREDAQDPA